MTSIAFPGLAINNAEQLRESVTEPTPNTRIYLTYGKVEPWTNDAAPPTPNTSVSSVYEVWRNMIGGKKITGNDIRHVVQRNTWTSGTVYSAYDDTNTNLLDETNLFFVVTSDFNVYKCISNGNGAVSTVEPSYVSSEMGAIQSDGYEWKYMYTISTSDQLNYMTAEYVPVKTLESDDGSIQWDVQTEAVVGAIYSVIVTNGGSGYSNVSNLSISLTGDGTSFTATGSINTSTNTVSSITITDPGTGYTYSDVSITGGGGSGATARAIISPAGGHGSNPLYELGGSRLIFSVKLKGTENDVLSASNDFRQIALVKDPFLKDSTVIPSNSAFSQAQTLTTTGSGDFLADEYVYQGASLATATFSGRVLEWLADASSLRVTDTRGTATSGTLTGATSSVVRFVTSVEDKDFEPYSGRLLYMDNIKPITRASDQTEQFKIILKF